MHKRREGRRVVVDLPASSRDDLAPVVALECEAPPAIYRAGGMRAPGVPHPRYDPCPSDIAG